MDISLAAEPVFHLGNFTVTNSLLGSLVTSLVLVTFGLTLSKHLKKGSSRVQSIVEIAFVFIIDLAESIGGKKARQFVPLVLTFFFFILFSNWLGLLPGFGSIGFREMKEGHEVFIPILRGATADLNTTLALALVSVFAIQFYGISRLKLGYFKRFFDLSSPINLFVGILELISDVAKIISFSFRLFGNVFAGEVLLTVIMSLVPVLLPLPFFGLEIFVGLIQALVFSMLTLVFIQMVTVEHGGEGVETDGR
jgi:F-type H+-transporting ATPase subunit a